MPPDEDRDEEQPKFRYEGGGDGVGLLDWDGLYTGDERGRGERWWTRLWW